jgi:hypothetical protein
MTGPRYVIRACGDGIRVSWKCSCGGLVAADPTRDRTPGLARGCRHCGRVWIRLADPARLQRLWALLDEGDAVELYGLEGPADAD